VEFLLSLSPMLSVAAVLILEGCTTAVLSTLSLTFVHERETQHEVVDAANELLAFRSLLTHREREATMHTKRGLMIRSEDG